MTPADMWWLATSRVQNQMIGLLPIPPSDDAELPLDKPRHPLPNADTMRNRGTLERVPLPVGPIRSASPSPDTPKPTGSQEAYKLRQQPVEAPEASRARGSFLWQSRYFPRSTASYGVCVLYWPHRWKF